jgi:hypothetical protein
VTPRPTTPSPVTAHDHDGGGGSSDRDATALDALAAVLAASCALHLRTIARRGGPDPDQHLDELRRRLVRREGRRTGLTRRRQIRHALEAARRGRPGAIAAADRHALVRDLRELDRALRPAARVGAMARGSAPPPTLLRTAACGS